MTNLNSVETKFKIDGKQYHFVDLKLEQAFNKHHICEVRVDFEQLDSVWMENPTKIIKLIGQDLSIEMTHLQTGETNLFQGIVTHVSMNGNNGEKNYITIIGASPTIKLEDTPTMNSFSDLTLDLIAKEAIENSGNAADVTINTKYKSTIDYIAQYNENCFQFLNRLSWLYGEWLFFDGTTAYFGKPQLDDAIQITYDEEITHFELSANLVPANVNRYEYLNHQDNEATSATPYRVDGVRGYIKASLDRSEEIYTSDALLPLHASIGSKKDLDDLILVDKYRRVSQMLTFKATSKTCKVKLGRLLSVNLPGSMRTTLKHVETFLVTQVLHEAHQDGSYTNSFMGIPSEMEHIPMDEVKAPVALSQIAWVTTNADDRGRVKVEFQWQKKLNKTTNWIRVQTPDGGSSDVVSSNRGFVFIPEQGDQVMINFENGDPNRPYVSGSIFKENKSKGGGANNAEKSIITKSGVQIVFNDDQCSLHIQDPSGNTWDMDGNGNINVYAPKDIKLKASNTIMLEAGKDVNVTAANEFTVDALRKVLMNTPELRQMIASSWFLHSTNSTVLNDNDLKLESSNAYLSGTNNLFMHSEKIATLNSLGTTHIKGRERNNFTNTTDTYEVTRLEVDAKILVHFRPKTTWRGEDYGFDWMRIGDTNMFNDQWYGNIVGYQYTDDTYTTLVTDHNKYNGKFKSDANMYQQLKYQYNVHTIPWLSKRDASGNAITDTSGNLIPEEYFVSWLSLYPGKEARLSLVLNVFEEADEIRFISDQTVLKVEPQAINLKASGIRVGKVDLPNCITVKCLNQFSSDKVIEVLVIKRDAQGREISKRLGGKLKVWSNQAAKRKKIKAVFIKVLTPANRRGVETHVITDERQRINQYLNQAYLELSQDSDMITLNINATDTAIPKRFTSFLEATTARVMTQNASDLSLQSYLKQQLAIQEGNRYDSYFKCFYFQEDGWGGNPYLFNSGFSSYRADYVVLFNSKDDQTAAHEFLHSLNLAHSFTNRPATSNNQFTYQYKQTENLLDYTQHDREHKNDRYALWYWQWVIANNSAT